MGYGLITGEFNDQTLDALFLPDILMFAGLAFIVTGIFRKMKLQEGSIAVIGVILSVIGTAAADLDTGNYVVNLILGTFIFTVDRTSSFCFFCWYLFVAAGLLFGKILQSVPDRDGLYKKLLVISAVIMTVYLASSLKLGAYFLTRRQNYYSASPLEAVGLLSIDLFLLSLFYFLLKKVHVSKFRILIEMSRNITSIYFIHWIFIGSIESVFCILLGLVFPYSVIYMIGALLLVVSFLLARLYQRLKKGRRAGLPEQ